MIIRIAFIILFSFQLLFNIEFYKTVTRQQGLIEAQTIAVQTLLNILNRRNK